LRRLQGPVTESLRVAFTSFRKFDDLVRDGVAERIDPPSLLQRYNGHRKRDAHEANRLGVEPVAFEILSDRHLASSSARGQRYTLPSCARPFPVLPIILYKKNRAVPWRQATLGSAPRSGGRLRCRRPPEGGFGRHDAEEQLILGSLVLWRPAGCLLSGAGPWRPWF
jgi:hypothetical protein